MSKARLFLLVLLAVSAGCKEDKPRQPPPPPPPPPVASVAQAGACTGGGGEVTDSISAPFFTRTIAAYCIDPQGEVRTYGDKGKLSIDKICTTAFDGECEVYMRFGIKRLVTLHYIDDAGKGSNVEVNLSQFGDVSGAYAMYTLRVVAGDPADPSTPKVLAAGAAGAIGTGRAYVWRGQYLAELAYVNEQESPSELAKSSDAILSAIGKDLGEKLPGAKTLPPSAQVLPAANRIPHGIVFSPKDILAWKGVGPAAMGFYRDGDKRWRVLSIVKDNADQAKNAFKTIKATPGTLSLADVGDEAARVIVPVGEGKAGGPKVEFSVARKGNVVWGVGDEEYAVGGADGDKARLSKDDATEKLRSLVAAAVPTAPAPSPSLKK
ncbi:MAG: hypothetical protein FWD69_11025 [Polyangiaceae bacterium]|nr:hypothetical protein [Polyangiaceae bacterium]